MMSEVRYDIYLHSEETAPLCIASQLGRHSAGPHQGDEAGMGVISCSLMHTSVFADLCCNPGMA